MSSTDWLDALGAALAIGLLAYLVWALIRAEEF
ncbi:MAG: K(+)-transporting ATPase subunit F [Curvibacter sp.]|nr:MAG: K(+)-transporting ATPase subunit F [Curvibacter sp.]